MRTKKKIIKEQQELIEQLQARLTQQAGAIEQLQTSVVEYRGREQSIANAMTEIAAIRARVAEEADKKAGELLSSAQTTRDSAVAESQEIVNKAYQDARDIVKSADMERRQKLEQTEAAINTYSEILQQYNEMVKDQVKTAEEHARKYAAYYQQLSFAVPELIGDTRDLGGAPEATAPLTEIDDDPAKLMRNIYTIEHRDIPDAEVPDRTSAEETAQDAPGETSYPEDETLPADDGLTDAVTAGTEDAPQAEETSDAADDAAQDEDAMPPSVHELVSDQDVEVAELDQLLDDIIRAAE